jgi:hypothetical protein
VLARADLSMDDVAGAGAQRVSVGSWLLWVGVAAMAEAAEEMRDSGDFTRLGIRVDPKWVGGLEGP